MNDLKRYHIMLRLTQAGNDWVLARCVKGLDRNKVVREALKFAAEHQKEFDARLAKLHREF